MLYFVVAYFNLKHQCTAIVLKEGPTKRAKTFGLVTKYATNTNRELHKLDFYINIKVGGQA